MNTSSDCKSLARAVETLASTIAEIITTNLRHHAAQMEQQLAFKSLEPTVTRQQLAEHFRVSQRTIENWTRKGYLPYFKISGIVRYKVNKVESFVMERFRSGRPRWR